MRAANENDIPYNVVALRDNEAEWLAARKRGIGASEVMHLFPEVAKWADANKLLNEKLGAESDFTENEDTMRGRLLEPAIVSLYNWKYKRNAVAWQSLVQSKETPYMLATPDALEGDLLLEIKCPRYPWKNGVPDYYKLQVWAQMYVTGMRTAEVVEFSGGTVKAHPLEYSERHVAAILVRAKSFWSQVEAAREAA